MTELFWVECIRLGKLHSATNDFVSPPNQSETSFQKLSEALLSTPHQNISIPHFETENWCMFEKTDIK